MFSVGTAGAWRSPICGCRSPLAGLHAHVAVGYYIAQTLTRDAWGRGHVTIKLSDLHVDSADLRELSQTLSRGQFVAQIP